MRRRQYWTFHCETSALSDCRGLVSPESGEDVFDQPDELLRGFEFRVVAAVLDDCEAAVGDAAVVFYLWNEESQFTRRRFLLFVQRDERQTGAPAGEG